jgi:hypothetical protein
MRRLALLLALTALAGCSAGVDEPVGQTSQAVTCSADDSPVSCGNQLGQSKGCALGVYRFDIGTLSRSCPSTPYTCTWTCFKKCKNMSEGGVDVNYSIDTGTCPQGSPNCPAKAACVATAPTKCKNLGGSEAPGYDWSCVPDDTTPGQRTKCYPCDDFEILNNPGQPHFLGMSSDALANEVRANGNALAHYVNDLRGLWRGTFGKPEDEQKQKGSTTAAQLIASAKEAYTCSLPKWIILNEISHGTWPKNKSYRHYVVQLAKALATQFQKSVIVASPFWNPVDQKAFKTDWKNLSKYAYIAVEANELDGQSVFHCSNNYQRRACTTQAERIAYALARYKASLHAYEAFGIPARRLMVVENFANTIGARDCNLVRQQHPSWHCNPADTFGRRDLSEADWKLVVEARDKGLRPVLGPGGFSGFLSYGWGGFDRPDFISQRHVFMKQYVNDWKSVCVKRNPK